MIIKGSVCVSGISLTIATLRRGHFEVSVIPHTLEVTTLHDKGPGSSVNLECDMIGRWVRRNLDSLPGRGPAGLSISDLEEQGF
jgi:riboflavin synthase